MNRWYRAYEGTVADPKLGEVALLANVSRSVVIAAWHSILESCAATQDGGRFETNPRRIAAALCEPLDSIERVLAGFTEVGMIIDGIATAWKQRQFESDSSTERSRKSRQQKRNADATLQQQHATPPETETETETEKKEEDSSLRSAELTLTSDDVRRETDDWPHGYREQFWRLYPRKVGKLAALKALERTRKSGVKFEAVVAGIERIPKQELQFVPHPATWLNRGGWDDEEIPGGSSGHRGPRALQDDRLSLTKAADRLIERAERGEFTFGPRPRLLPESSEDDLRLLPERRSA